MEEAEARALLCGLKTLAALYRGPIIAQTDCSFLTKELQPDSVNRSACFSVLHDIKKELQKFQGSQVIYANRKQNRLAHCLTARARRMGNMQTGATVPDDLKAVLAADCLPWIAEGGDVDWVDTKKLERRWPTWAGIKSRIGR